MKTLVYVGAALLGGLLMGLTARTDAQDIVGEQDAAEARDTEFLGTISGREYTTSYKMPFDVSADRSYIEIDRIAEVRTRIHISDLYGPLVHISAHGDDVVLWFKDSEDVMRNAVLKNVTKELLHVQRVPARQISISYR
jgi:hypothetical protein